MDDTANPLGDLVMTRSFDRPLHLFSLPETVRYGVGISKPSEKLILTNHHRAVTFLNSVTHETRSQIWKAVKHSAIYRMGLANQRRAVTFSEVNDLLSSHLQPPQKCIYPTNEAAVTMSSLQLPHQDTEFSHSVRSCDWKDEYH